MVASGGERPVYTRRPCPTSSGRGRARGKGREAMLEARPADLVDSHRKSGSLVSLVVGKTTATYIQQLQLHNMAHTQHILGEAGAVAYIPFVLLPSVLMVTGAKQKVSVRQCPICCYVVLSG